jgi:hypothetical protein
MNDEIVYNLRDAMEGERIKAPTRQQISMLTNLPDIWEMVSYAEDQIIAISTCLEFYNDDDSFRSRRIAALIYWKQGVKNLKNRANQIMAEQARAKKEAAELVGHAPGK